MSCPPSMDCAHQASGYLALHGYPELNAGKGSFGRDVNNLCRCECGKVIRAKQLRDWARKKGQVVDKVDQQGTFLVYQQRSKDGQGHVYAVIEGKVCGNKLGDTWTKSDSQTIIKLK